MKRSLWAVVFLGGANLAGIAMSIFLSCAILYCAVSGLWLPAIFFLLFRREFAGWLTRFAQRTVTYTEAFERGVESAAGKDAAAK